jgi:hypothetical protein
MLKALNYSLPPSFLRAIVYGAMRVRAICLRKISFKKYPSFVTTEKNRSYPKGYEISQLGPEIIVKKIQ